MITRNHLLLTALGTGFAFSQITAFAAPIAVDSFTSSADTFLNNSNADANYGGSSIFRLGSTSGNQRLNGLLEFDLSSLPSGADIQSATLSLRINTRSSASVGVQVYRQTQDWTEGAGFASASNINAAPGGITGGNSDDASWNEATAGVAWSGDFNSTLTGTAGWGNGTDDNLIGSMAEGAGFNDPYTIDLTTTVQGWVDGTFANEGLLLTTGTASGTRTISFNSREIGNEALRPTLEVTYVIPEPGSLALAAVGSVLLLGRKRRRRN